MKIYFAANPQASEKLKKRFDKIIEIFNQAGVLVMSNLDKENLFEFSNQDLDKFSQTGEVMLEKMGGLVIEGTMPIAESGYLIALALAHKKPILYLIEKGQPIDKNLNNFKKDQNIVKFLKIQPYDEKDLPEKLLEFLKEVETGEGREIPAIKFTLRITPRIERYLYWKTHNTKLSKADFLRELIEDLIDKDENYQKFIKRKGD